MLGNLAFRFLVILVASVVLVKLVSLLLANSDLQALELLSAADSYIERDGGAGGGDR